MSGCCCQELPLWGHLWFDLVKKKCGHERRRLREPWAEENFGFEVWYFSLRTTVKQSGFIKRYKPFQANYVSNVPFEDLNHITWNRKVNPNWQLGTFWQTHRIHYPAGASSKKSRITASNPNYIWLNRFLSVELPSLIIRYAQFSLKSFAHLQLICDHIIFCTASCHHTFGFH